jgi:phosphotransferase system HPr-like phosphotransfer protein
VGLGLKPSKRSFPEEDFLPVMARKRLPRNVGQTDLVQEQHRIAEVATKYLQAREMLRETGVRRIDDHEERHRRFARVCSEEHARVYEATIHNLQSTYDTHIQNTVVEAKDSRLSRLRGYISPALHLLQAVTFLAHFIERHETVIRSEDAKSKIAELIDSSEVEGVAWNLFLFWADRFLDSGVPLAQELLPEYTNLIELEVDLPSELSLHARPAALVVGIVNHYGTPVEMEVGGKRCNAGSILELLVTVGSLPGHKNFTFRGDERPLQAIGLLFQHSLGEHGLENLPEELGYLRH